jgi:rhodanese-related sulfurtransferase
VNWGQLVDLLEGRYDALVTDFIVIDCRFEYEYKGGHIAGAVNLPTPEALERHLLRDGEGAYAATQAKLPPPSKSGEPDETGSTRKTVLIFHCEFSVKRAPTLYVLSVYLLVEMPAERMEYTGPSTCETGTESSVRPSILACTIPMCIFCRVVTPSAGNVSLNTVNLGGTHRWITRTFSPTALQT